MGSKANQKCMWEWLIPVYKRHFFPIYVFVLCNYWHYKMLEWNQCESERCTEDFLYALAALSPTGETLPAFSSYIITHYKGGSARNAVGLFPPGVLFGRVCRNTPSRQSVRSARMFWKTACSEWECNNSRLIFQQPALITLINILLEVRSDAYQRFLP